MVGIRHSVATATAFLKPPSPSRKGGFVLYHISSPRLTYGTKHNIWAIIHTSPSKRPLWIWYIKSLTNYYASANACSPWQGTGLIVALATIVCRVSAASRTFPNKRCTKYRIHFGANNMPTAVVKSRQLPWYTLYIHCTYTNVYCRYRQN